MCVFPADTAHLEASQGGAGPLANPRLLPNPNCGSWTESTFAPTSSRVVRCGKLCLSVLLSHPCPSLPASHRVLTGDEKGNRGDKSIQEGVLLGKFDKGVLTSDGWLIE